jgi:hypothetical protein
VLLQVLDGVVVAAEDVVRVPVDLDVATDWQFSRSDELVVFVNILVLVASQEGALYDATVLDGWLVDRDAVVAQVERDDEAALDIFRDSRVKSGSVAKHFLVIVNRLEEIALGFLGDQVVDVAEGVDLISKSVIGRNLSLGGLGNWRHLSFADGEVSTVFLGEERLSEAIDTMDVKGAAKRDDWLPGVNFIASQVIVSNKAEAWLVDIGSKWQLLSPEKFGEGITAIVREVNFTNLNCVIGEVVVDHEGQVFRCDEEAKDFAIVVKELFLVGNLATTKSLFHVLLHLVVAGAGDFD